MSSADNLGRKFASSAVWVLAEQWSTKGISLLLFALLARILTAADFGLVALATSFIAILQVFVNSGFAKALIQKPHLDPDDATTAFWTSLAIGFGSYGLLIAFAHPIATVTGTPGLASVLIVLGVMLPISALSRTPAALLARDFKFRSLSIRTVAATIIGAAVALPLAIFGAGIWALVAQALTEATVAVVVLWSSTTWRPAWRFSTTSLRSLWRTGLSLLGIELLDAVQSQADKIIVGIFFSTTDLGVYALAQRIGLILQEVASAVITRVSLTTFSRAQGDTSRVNRIFLNLTQLTATIAFPVFGIVAVLSPQLVPFLFGPGWEAAVPLIWIMSAGWAFASIAMFDRSVLVGTGHAGAAFWLAAAQNVISIALIFIFAPLGVIGIAFSRLARIATWPIRLAVLRRLISLPVQKYLKQIGLAVAAVLPAILVIVALQGSSWANAGNAFWLFAVPIGVAGTLASFLLSYGMAGSTSRAAVRRRISSLIRRKKGGTNA